MMGTIRFNKNLPSQTNSTIGHLEENLSSLFESLVIFEEELSKHTGKAAAALHEKMKDNMEFFSKAGSGLLYFANTVLNFVKAVEAADESTSGSGEGRSRAEFKYTFSENRVEGEIKLTAKSLENATKNFGNTINALEDLLTKFNELLDNVIFDTEFPWEDVDSVWNDGKNQIKNIIAHTETRLKDLTASSETLVTELERVDNLISAQMQRVK
ncbi:hypothetical protein [Metabacillus fastidiosus]|uniref:hypothetical protein n=1 Tax=Metabacillus fastidiosus TaxID=1458 RepID=UPI003D29887C